MDLVATDDDEDNSGDEALAALVVVLWLSDNVDSSPSCPARRLTRATADWSGLVLLLLALALAAAAVVVVIAIVIGKGLRGRGKRPTLGRCVPVIVAVIADVAADVVVVAVMGRAGATVMGSRSRSA